MLLLYAFAMPCSTYDEVHNVGCTEACLICHKIRKASADAQLIAAYTVDTGLTDCCCVWAAALVLQRHDSSLGHSEVTRVWSGDLPMCVYFKHGSVSVVVVVVGVC